MTFGFVENDKTAVGRLLSLAETCLRSCIMACEERDQAHDRVELEQIEKRIAIAAQSCSESLQEVVAAVKASLKRRRQEAGRGNTKWGSESLPSA